MAILEKIKNVFKSIKITKLQLLILILLIAIGLIIILGIIFWWNHFVTDGFENNLEVGEPLITSIAELETNSTYKSLQTTRLNLQFIPKTLQSNLMHDLAICLSEVNSNLYLAMLNVQNPLEWTLTLLKGNNTTTPAINLVVEDKDYPPPSNIVCAGTEGYVTAINNNTFFYYNQPLNNLEQISCVFYLDTSNDNVYLRCLELPLMTGNTTTTLPGNTRTTLQQPYDKLRIMASNDKYLYCIGCSNKLYYLELENGLPVINSEWKELSLIDNNNLISNIRLLSINDNYLYFAINQPETNSIYMISQDGEFTINDYNIPKTMLNTILNIVVNNDIIFLLGQNNTSSLLYWCPLTKDISILTNWKNITISSRIGSYDMVLFLDALIIYSLDSTVSNIIIPLNYTLDNTVANTSSTNNSTTTTTTPNTTTTSPVAQNSTTTTSRIATAASTTGNAITTSTTAGATSTTAGATSTTAGATSTTAGATSTTAGATSTTAGATSTTAANTNTTTTRGNTQTTNTTQRNTAITRETPTVPPLNEVLRSMEMGGGGGDTGINNNHDLLNDILSGNNIFGNNLYMSPMNQNDLYLPATGNGLSMGPIRSGFLPIVKLN